MTALDQRAELARRLAVMAYQTRRYGDSSLVAIAGFVGHVKPDGDWLVIHLRKTALGQDVRKAGRELLLAGAIAADPADDALIIARLPADDTEARSFQAMLGLHREGRSR